MSIKHKLPYQKMLGCGVRALQRWEINKGLIQITLKRFPIECWNFSHLLVVHIQICKISDLLGSGVGVITIHTFFCYW